MRELRQPHRIALEPLGEIMRGRLPLQCRVHREHDLVDPARGGARDQRIDAERSEEHTSELQSLMRISYAVFCLKQTKHNTSKLTSFLLSPYLSPTRLTLYSLSHITSTPR